MNIVIMDQLYTEIHEYWWNHSNCCYIDEKVAQKSSVATCKLHQSKVKTMHKDIIFEIYLSVKHFKFYLVQ